MRRHRFTAARCLVVDVSVRVAGDDDLGVLAGLRRRWNEEQAGGPIDDPGFDAAFRAWWEAERTTRTFFLVAAGGAAVGMANVKRYDRMPVAGSSSAGRWGYVGNVFVLAEHRNARIGEFLMNEILAWASREGLAHLRLAPSPLSATFYERLGYTAGAVVELDPPLPSEATAD
jgi:GNAT superfamily N-acetyltransferase